MPRAPKKKPTAAAATLTRQRPTFVSTLLGIVLLVGTIYLAKPVLVPLALAVLFAFILNPLVGLVQRLNVPRVPAVLAVVLVTLVLAVGIGWGVFAQLRQAGQRPAAIPAEDPGEDRRFAIARDGADRPDYAGVPGRDQEQGGRGRPGGDPAGRGYDGR